MLFMLGLLSALVMIKNSKPHEDSIETEINYEDYYSEYVLTSANVSLKKLENDEYIETGEIMKDVYLELADYNNEEYFKLKNMDYYVHYQDVKKTEKMAKETYYKDYIYFNENVVSDHMRFYKDEKLVFEIHDKLSLPILIKDTEKLYVLYNDDIYYVLKSETDIVENHNTDKAILTDLPVFMYHFFFSSELGEKAKDGNYLDIKTFREHVKYLTDNNYKTLRMNEVEMYVDGKINLPQKSAVLTMDDGHESVFTHVYPVMEEYKNINITLFFITYWSTKESVEYYKKENVEIHSHSEDMHRGGCPTKHGGLIQCIDYNAGILDLTTSRDKLGEAFVFCYPFGDYNDHAFKLLTDSGYRLAFTVEEGYVKKGMNKLALPRVRIGTGTNLNSFISKLKN